MEGVAISLLCGFIIYQNQRIDMKLERMDERQDRIEIRLAHAESLLPKRKTDTI